jgi:hypothetical protein
MRACKFFDKTAPAAKKINEPQSSGHFESDSPCPDSWQIMNQWQSTLM